VLACSDVLRRRRSIPVCPFALGAASLLASPAARAEPPPASAAPLPAPFSPRVTAPQLAIPTLHALGLMSVMRASEAYLWPEPFAETNRLKLAYHYQQAFSRPPLWDSSRPLFQADGDRWQINVLGHGLFGSELYVRARTCHFAPWQALLFAGVASATWEYGFEANGVRPSALDLTFTPLAGLLLGEARYQGLSAARRLEAGALRSTLTVLFDPLGHLERGLGAGC
jgi:hypothetical protein